MDPNQNYRVLRLLVENYKRLKAVDVTPGRNVVRVSGRNAQGKSSLLDSIAAVLGGKKQMASEPVRKGADGSEILCVLGDEKPELLVKRVIRPGGKTELEITAAGGFKAPTPQAILDSLCNAVAFDPLAFLQMNEAQQTEMLRALVGLDFSELDAKRSSLYQERTIVNREVKAKTIAAAGMQVPDDTPTEEVSVEDLMAEIRRRQEHNRRNQTERDRLQLLSRDQQEAQRAVVAAEAAVRDAEARLGILKSALEDAQINLQGVSATYHAQQATVAVLEDQDTMEVQRQVLDAQRLNAAVTRRRQRDQLIEAARAMEAEAARISAEIEAIDAEKESKLASVSWPIQGLSFGDGGVTYQGVPLSQASSAEALTVSFAMAAALHPKLKIALIRNASLLDEDQMAKLQELVAHYDMQAWLEVVDATAGPCGILIEDGSVTEGGTPPNTPLEMNAPKKRGRRPKAPPEPFQESTDPTQPDEPPFAVDDNPFAE